MIKAVYNFINSSCKFAGDVIESADKSIFLCDNSVTYTTEKIIDIYLKYGVECVHHLGGVASFVLWDKKNDLVLAVRDKIGERPMYYSQLPMGIVFSTDLKEILPLIKYPAIRPHELAQPIRHNFPIDMQRTWIEQINRLQPGEYAIVDKGGLQLHTYWKRDHTPTFKGTKVEALAEALRILRKSVKECVETSNGPVAVLLSGGIDSTSIAALTKEIQSEVHVISAGYRGNNATYMDERPVARKFAQDNGLIYHEIELDVNDFQSYLDEVIPYLDEPCFDVNCMVQYALYKKAAEMGFKTIFSGLGGDEQFYSYAEDHRMLHSMQLRNQFIHLYPVKEHRKDYLSFLLHNWKYLLWPTESMYASEEKPTRWTYEPYRKFAQNAILEYNNDIIRFKDIDVGHRFPQNTDIISLYDFTFATFAGLLCVYMANKLCVANGIEVRFPLLNPEFVSFMDSIPAELKFDPKQTKRFQKEMMASVLPDYILHAKKRGFEPPFEFIWKMCGEYSYKHIHADYTFYNSMVADRIIDNLLFKA